MDTSFQADIPDIKDRTHSQQTEHSSIDTRQEKPAEPWFMENEVSSGCRVCMLVPD
jgi:hypothetical protein